MTAPTTPILGMRAVKAGQGLPSIPVNEAIYLLEIFGRYFIAVSTSLLAEPVSPSNGEVWVISGTPTGTDWAAFADKDIAYYQDGWHNLTPTVDWKGVQVYDQAANSTKNWNGTAWVAGVAGGAHLPLAGGTMTGAINMAGNNLDGGGAMDITNCATLQLRGSGGNLLFDFSDNGFSHGLRVLGSSATGLIELDFLGVSAARRYSFPDIAGMVMLNLLEDTTPQLGGELAAGAHSVGFTQQVLTNPSGVLTVNWTLGNKGGITLAANATSSSWTDPSNPCTVDIIIKQDATGGRTIVWPSSVKWAGGSAPVLSTAANAVDYVALRWDGTNYWASASLDFS